MKKFAFTAVLVLAVSFLSPLMPAAHAASANDVLALLVAQNPGAARVQELLAIKQDWEQGNRGAVVGRVAQGVAQAALSKTGQSEYAGVLSAVANGGGDLRTTMEANLRQQLTSQVTTRLSPYNDKLNLLADLLQNTGLMPKLVSDSGALTGGGLNYPQIIR